MDGIVQITVIKMDKLSSDQLQSFMFQVNTEFIDIFLYTYLILMYQLSNYLHNNNNNNNNNSNSNKSPSAMIASSVAYFTKFNTISSNFHKQPSNPIEDQHGIDNEIAQFICQQLLNDK
ncbi:hypothetical protein T4A_3156 [Trichinella pseudospiralis]|uniref:Uncharacterized protein n=1 Tax=Trichinella pseudospiralis TaxID=6337 RepID=A0A0V1E374_TRIPS|nr:hypothetical protein T4A_3156 [Trichinella pseudospiralis]